MSLPLPFAVAELRYRTRTHTNPGRSLVELHDGARGRGLTAIVTGLPAPGGPSIVNAAGAIAAAIDRELLSDEERRRSLALVLMAPVGARLVTFGEAFDGWYARPSFEPLSMEQLSGLVFGAAAAAS